MISREISRVVGALPKNMTTDEFYSTMRAVYLAVDGVRPTKKECLELWKLYWRLGKTRLEKTQILQTLTKKMQCRLARKEFEHYSWNFELYTISRNGKIIWQN